MRTYHIQIVLNVLDIFINTEIMFSKCVKFSLVLAKYLKVNEFISSQSEVSRKQPMTVEEVAMGFIQVANETMCRPIRALTQVCH